MPWTRSNRKRNLPPDWEKRRAIVLKREPICYLCHKAPSTQVDHQEPNDNHDLENLRGVCTPCHRRKTLIENNGGSARSVRPSENHPGMA